MLISVLNIKVTCEWHKAIKLNYKNTRTTVVFVLRLPSTLHRPQLSVISPMSALRCYLVVSRCRACAVASMASWTAYSTWTPQKLTLSDDHYLRNRSTLDIGVLGYIGIVQHKEHSPEVLSIPPGTACIINQQDATLAVLCLLKTTSMLYMFRTPFASIFRSTTNCNSSHWCLSCCNL